MGGQVGGAGGVFDGGDGEGDSGGWDGGGAGADGGSDSCVVCFDGAKTHVLIPCGHRCLCARCAKRYDAGGSACPVCRQAVKHVQRVWDT